MTSRWDRSLKQITSQVFFNFEILWLFGQKVGATTHREKVGKENRCRLKDREQVDFDYIWYEVSEDIQMEKSNGIFLFKEKII